MDCPKCAHEMESIAFGEVEIDRCTHCQGIWFDHLEQEQLAELENAASVDIGDPEVGKHFNLVTPVDCPRCYTQMDRTAEREQPTLRFEVCAMCEGVFFDAGEFREYSEERFMGSVKTMLGG